jgi:hypothetical protein
MPSEYVLIAESLPAVWFVAELHESKIRTMISFMLISIALSFKAPITKAISKAILTGGFRLGLGGSCGSKANAVAS